ncbi:Exosome complex component RRP43 [Camellia lanceoleosa]|uniref:Exosome complex component RRP43 n=1 Tax=Camellia lanceoleosa TaxID=1840588 RepID=A0ACC0GAS9_9ERIC|nr:Exosome complex component RRP43 [Camellia lanceoleosa]
MSSANASSDLSSEMEVDAFRCLFPLRFHERHLLESTCPDARNLGKARDTTLALGTVASADGSDLAKIGCTTTLAAIKMEVMTPTTESPDEGCIAIDFHMHPICSPIVRPGRPADAAPVISKQLSDTILSSGMIYFKELSLVNGKAAWIAYLDIYCLDADGTLFDDALLAAVAAFSHSHSSSSEDFAAFLDAELNSTFDISPDLDGEDEDEDKDDDEDDSKPNIERVLTLIYQPFALGTMAILAYNESKIDTRRRNLTGYILFFISTFALLVVNLAITPFCVFHHLLLNC